MDQIKEIPIVRINVGEHDQRIDSEDPGTIELAASIKRVGVINPIILRADGDILQLVAGHRRLVAARMAGCEHIPCIVRTSQKEMDTEITFAENFFRKDLSPIELSCALKDCLDREQMKVSELAAGFHKSENWVRSMIAIAAWPNDVQEAIHNKAISVSAASNLAVINDENYRAFLVRNAEESGATARTTAAWLQAWRAMQPPEEAVTAEPVQTGVPVSPMVPQAPCLCCGQVFPVDRMSHVPMCGGCIQEIRRVGMSQH